jgi:hypothetical protein
VRPSDIRIHCLLGRITRFTWSNVNGGSLSGASLRIDLLLA